MGRINLAQARIYCDTVDLGAIELQDGCQLSTNEAIPILNDLNLIKIWPNPTTDWVSILLPEIGSNHVVEVVDASGKTVMARALLNYEKFINLNLTSLAGGVYTLTFKKYGNATHFGRVVKK